MPDGARSRGTAASRLFAFDRDCPCYREEEEEEEVEHFLQEAEVPGDQGKFRGAGRGGGRRRSPVGHVGLRTQLKENHSTPTEEIQGFVRRLQKQQQRREIFQKHTLKSRRWGLTSSVPQGHGVLRLQQQQQQQPPVARLEEEEGRPCYPSTQGCVCPRFELPHGPRRNKNVNITLTPREAGSPPARNESRSMLVRPGHDLARVRPLRVCRREEASTFPYPSSSSSAPSSKTASQGSVGFKGQLRTRCPKRMKVMSLTPKDAPQKSQDTEDALLLLGRLASLSPLTAGDCCCNSDGEADEGRHKLTRKRPHRKAPLPNSSSSSIGAAKQQQEKEKAKKEPIDTRVSPSPHESSQNDDEGHQKQARAQCPAVAAIPHRHLQPHHNHNHYHLHRRFRSKAIPNCGSSGGGSSNSSYNLLTTKHSSSSSSSSCSSKFFLASLLIMVSVLVPAECGNPDAKRLYDDLLSNYNKLVRPVVNVTDVLTVRIKLKLSQLIDVNLKSQIMTTNLWVEQYWYDYKLIWEPKEYGGVEMLHVPSDHIWRPDIVLYNNADGNFEVTLSTKATLSWNGLVEWKPPAIYKSSCEIDVEYFPFDEQTCVMKFGSWTYDGFQVDLRHLDEIVGTNMVEMGVDLSEFYMSVEWDILEVPAVRHEKFYTCCDEPYLDITFNITMRRKTLFYTVNLIIPCMGISFLTVLTFYLPSDSGEKVTLSISILISLHVFFLLVVEIIPPTSLVVPLLGKYLIFAMILVSISICVTVLVLNVHFRSPQTHKMAPWVKRVFIHILPRLLIMKRPQYQHNKHSSLKSEFKSLWSSNENSKPLNSVFMESNRVMVHTCNGNELRGNYYRQEFDEPIYKQNDPNLPYDTPLGGHPRDDFSPMGDGPFTTPCRIHGATNFPEDTYILENSDKSPTFRPFQHNLPHCSPEVHRTCWCVSFIAEHTRLKEDSTKVKEDWKYVAMVLDRLFLWIFTLAVLVGTAGIILQAPSLYDDRIPLDKVLSEVYRQHTTKH